MVFEALLLGYLGCKAADWYGARRRSRITRDRAPATAGALARGRAKPIGQAGDHSLRWSLVALLLTAASNIQPLLLIPGIVTLVYINTPILRQAYRNLRRERHIDHTVLTALIFLLGMINGFYLAMAVGGCLYFFGIKLLASARGRSERFIRDMVEENPDTAWVLRHGAEVELPIAEIRTDDIVVVGTGRTIPVDGRIVQGHTRIDQRILTGESRPVERAPGDPVFASSVVLGGRIAVRVEGAGEHTVIARIAHMLQHSFDHKDRIQLKGEAWADRSSLPFLLAGTVCYALAGPTAGIVMLNSRPGNGIRILGALGTLNHVKLASDRGIVVKDGRALEGLREVDTMVFDKTGTLTLEEVRVVGVSVYGETHGEDEVLGLAAAAEGSLEHPIARAIVAASEARGQPRPVLDDTAYHVGHGVAGHLAGRTIRVGSARFMAAEGIALSAPARADLRAVDQRGDSLILVALDRQLIGGTRISYTLRPEIPALLQGLRQRGVRRLYILSGDDEAPTRTLAQQLGMDGYFSRVLPDAKASVVGALQAAGHRVCFVGDGINDALAMKQADVAISFSGAPSIAADAAQVLITGSSLAPIGELLDISWQLDRNLRQSLGLVSIAPTVMNITCLGLFNINLLDSLFIKNIGFLAGLGNAISPGKTPPRIRHRRPSDER